MPHRSQGQPGTGERLVAAALELFARKWYGTVSVAEVCRAAGLSNGVFYRYFDSKEAIVKVILARANDMIREALEEPRGEGPAQRLRAFAEKVFRFSREHPDLIKVYREGQYRFFEFEHRLAGIYKRCLGQALGRDAGEADYLFAMGGLRFCAIQRAFGIADIDPAAVEGILEHGLFRGFAFDPEKVFGGSATPLPMPLHEEVRGRLLRSGRRLFGEKGYFETNIHEVAGAANVSVGAFYTYFPSKETFYAELIGQAGRDIRCFIARNLEASNPAGLNALEYELRGLWLWLVYLSIDKHCYNIVREAEFVLPAKVRDYYGAFAAGYRKRPRRLRLAEAAPGIDEGSAIAFLMGLAHYLGMEAAFEASPVNARALLEAIGRRLALGFPECRAREHTLTRCKEPS